MNKISVTITKAACDAVIFDMDGVVTKTADVHFKAWKQLFDHYLEKNRRHDQRPFSQEDYHRYVDGKPRLEGMASFFDSRNINLPEGDRKDGPEEETLHGLGNRKNLIFNRLIEKNGVEVYQAAVQLLKKLRDAGFGTAVVTSSKNCVAVLKAAGIEHLFDHKIDGLDSEKLNLRGKPRPDIFLEATDRLNVRPGRTAILEDAISGVRAGKEGGFGLIIGVNRADREKDLLENGADAVVTDISAIKVDHPSSASEGTPSGLDRFAEIANQLKNNRVAVFLDYDGTLTPIVDDPDTARLPDDMKAALVELAERVPVAVISGRDRLDVQKKVGLNNIYYAGSHGFDIAGPDQDETNPDRVKEFLPDLDQAEEQIRNRIATIDGAWVERKKFSIAVHYRAVEEKDIDRVKEAVDAAAGKHPALKQSGGKKIFEIQPGMDWNKGKALLWLLDKLNLDTPDVVPLYIGDDVTDEHAFAVLENRGIGIAVMEQPGETRARYRLSNPDEVRIFLEHIIATQQGTA